MLRKSIVLCLLLLSILMSDTVFAKGPPNKVTIIGPGMPEPIEITESALLDSVSMGQVVDFESPIAEPQEVTPGVEITRWYLVGETRLKAIDKFVYYPDPKGGNGTIYYDGIIDKMFIYGGSPNDGKWFRATESGDLVLQELLAKHDLLPEAGKSPQSTLLNNALRGLVYTSLMVVSITIIYLIYGRSLRRSETNEGKSVKSV